MSDNAPTARVLFDSIESTSFPDPSKVPFDATAGYVDGRWPSSSPIRARFPDLPHLTIAVRAANDALCLDIEEGNATPAEAPAWLDRQYARGVSKPVLYCNTSTISAVRAAVGDRPFYWWSARYRNPRQAVLEPGAAASQWNNTGPNGENVDQSVMTDEFYTFLRGATLSDAQRVIDIARSQVGYREGISSSGSWNNDQKYSKELPGFAWSNFQPWCDTFVAWCFWKAGLTKALDTVASTVAIDAQSAAVWTSYQAWLKAGRFTEYPVIGGQVIYGTNKHTGICYAYDATYIYTVEGNTNDSGSAEGNGVYLKRRLRTDPYVTGYGVPLYPDGVIISADPKWNNPNPVQEADDSMAFTPEGVTQLTQIIDRRLASFFNHPLDNKNGEGFDRIIQASNESHNQARPANTQAFAAAVNDALADLHVTVDPAAVANAVATAVGDKLGQDVVDELLKRLAS